MRFLMPCRFYTDKEGRRRPLSKGKGRLHGVKGRPVRYNPDAHQRGGTTTKQKSENLRRIPRSLPPKRREQQLLYAHAIAHSSSWRKAVGKTQQEKDIAYFHRRMRRQGIHVNK
jgi:hypothetical protein